MKKLLNLFIAFTLITISAIGQDVQTGAPVSAEEYMKKSRENKTIGFICLGITAASVAIAAPGNINFDALGTVLTIGLVSGITSIPLFIAAGKNKRKAQMMMSSQKTAIGLPYGKGRAVTGITMSIPLGK